MDQSFSCHNDDEKGFILVHDSNSEYIPEEPSYSMAEASPKDKSEDLIHFQPGEFLVMHDNYCVLSSDALLNECYTSSSQDEIKAIPYFLEYENDSDGDWKNVGCGKYRTTFQPRMSTYVGREIVMIFSDGWSHMGMKIICLTKVNNDFSFETLSLCKRCIFCIVSFFQLCGLFLSIRFPIFEREEVSFPFLSGLLYQRFMNSLHAHKGNAPPTRATIGALKNPYKLLSIIISFS